jgi:bis(5'-nucleosyl)-tetraphosphatase (symmetrical)
MRWFVGDIQGCVREFESLLQKINFQVNTDEIICLGDMIRRGPASLEAARLWHDVGGQGVIGNHEIHALLMAAGVRTPMDPELKRILDAEDGEALLTQMRALPVLAFFAGIDGRPDVWAVHAGIRPQWTDLHSVSARLNHGDHNDQWLTSADVSFATQARCCTPSGEPVRFSGTPEERPSESVPWDSLYKGDALVVHGHWARRGFYRGPRTMGLDSGCVYGGALTAWCQDDGRIVQVSSRQKQI